MDKHNIVRIIQIIISAILVGLILIQQRGSGLSSIFGGGLGGEFYGTRRGLEKIVFILTIIFSVLFVLSAILGLVIQ
jgi:preprotein translocase subunit SecG